MWDMCQILNIWHISHTKHHLTHLSDVLNAIFFATCYSRVTNLPRYDKLWHMDLLIFYSSFSLISLSSSPSAIQYSPPPSPFSHTLSSSVFPFALFSSHSWIWATTDFLSTITDLLHWFFFPLLFALSSLFYLRVAYWRGSLGCGFGLWLFVLSWAADSLFVVLRVADSLFYLWRFHRFTVSLKVSSIHSTSTAYR